MLGIHDPIIGREDMEAVAAAMSSGWLSGGGPSNEALEGILQDKLHLHTRPLSVVNGTGALQLAALLCGFERGDHALVSDNGFIVAANAVRLAGG
ncbi:MAG: DegT/DnrJ/EryC1/StrS aminotransferase family protein [Bdellovibrionales bacterium]|nr:DegT/DnrJ/EryC1/StrS aminotransferase family protein [Bdellovibrionales bacterium]